MKVICQNRRARHVYQILETIEAGLVLRGTEVKSLRDGKVNLSDAYADVVDGELWLLNLHISPYKQASHFGHEPTRRRKLLVHRRELERLRGKVIERGLTLVPLRLYFQGSWAKVELGLARGKKMYDRRREIAERDSRREVARAVRRHDERTGGGGGRARSMLGSLLIVLALALGPGPGASPALAGTEVEVVRGPNQAPERAEVWRSDGALYFSLSAAAGWWEAVKVWDPDRLSMRLRVGSREGTLYLNSPWVELDGEIIRLPAPVRIREGVLWVPLEFIERASVVFTGQEARWDEGSSSLRFVPSGINILSLEMRAVEGGVLEVRVTLAQPLAYDLATTAQGEIRLRIENGVVDEEAAARWEALLPVQSVSAVNRSDYAEIKFELADEGGTASASSEAGGRVVLVRMVDFIPEEAADPDLLKLRPLTSRMLARGYVDHGPPTVVIDPGHGESERGAIGPTGYLEKAANLLIARQLKQILEQEGGFRVYLTREEDRLPPLKQEALPLQSRAEMGNLFSADVFISIHCNAWMSPRARGFEIYHQMSVLAEDASPDAEETHDPDYLVKEGDLEVVIWELAQDARLKESRRLASSIQEEMRRLAIPDRGVKQARFGVLEGLFAPGVLVEVAFISNPVEEALLRDASFRRRVAESLARAIRRFLREREVP